MFNTSIAHTHTHTQTHRTCLKLTNEYDFLIWCVTSPVT